MKITKEQLKNTFPNLAKELKFSDKKVTMKSMRSDKEKGERLVKVTKSLVSYDPDIVDFLRRCDTKKQAEEIIEYMEKHSEISTKYAKNLRQQLSKKGLRSFGSKKEDGYYFKTLSH